METESANSHDTHREGASPFAITFGAMAFSTFVFDTPTFVRGSTVHHTEIFDEDDNGRRRGDLLTMALPVYLRPRRRPGSTSDLFGSANSCWPRSPLLPDQRSLINPQTVWFTPCRAVRVGYYALVAGLTIANFGGRRAWIWR